MGPTLVAGAAAFLADAVGFAVAGTAALAGVVFFTGAPAALVKAFAALALLVADLPAAFLAAVATLYSSVGKTAQENLAAHYAMFARRSNLI
jgi:hypothetical protein